MLCGAETLETSFTSSANASPVFTGVLDLDGTSIKASIGVGVFSGVMTGDINFTQTSTPSAILSGVQEYISSFDSAAAANKYIWCRPCHALAPAPDEMDAHPGLSATPENEGEEGRIATGPDDHARVQEYCHQGWKLGNQTSIL